MVSQLPFRGLHLFAKDAALSTNAIALVVPLPDEHEAGPAAFVYVTRGQVERIAREALCLAPCCAKVKQAPLPLFGQEAA